MLLFSGENAAPAMQAELAKNIQLGKKVGVLASNEDAESFEEAGALVYRLGSRADLAKIARHLYAGLRSLDSQGMDVILACDFGTQGLGLAIRDRLTRAATKIIGAG
jgi:L-threonylcarbamoyladenylate synthase